MEDNKTVKELNAELEDIKTEVFKAKKKLIDKIILDISTEMVENNKKEPLSVREMEEYLRGFYYRIKGIQDIK